MKIIEEYTFNKETFFIFGGYCDGCIPIIKNDLTDFSNDEEYFIFVNGLCFKNFYINEVYLIKDTLINLVQIDKFERCGISLFKITNFSGNLIIKYYVENFTPKYILKFESLDDENVMIYRLTESEWKKLGGKFNNYHL